MGEAGELRKSLSAKAQRLAVVARGREVGTESIEEMTRQAPKGKRRAYAGQSRRFERLARAAGQSGARPGLNIAVQLL